MRIIARFKGNGGSKNYIFGRMYRLDITLFNPLPTIKISRNDKQTCYYRSLETFLKNWDTVRLHEEKPDTTSWEVPKQYRPNSFIQRVRERFE